jgi:hypothetical protein
LDPNQALTTLRLPARSLSPGPDRGWFLGQPTRRPNHNLARSGSDCDPARARPPLTWRRRDCAVSLISRASAASNGNSSSARSRPVSAGSWSLSSSPTTETLPAPLPSA